MKKLLFIVLIIVLSFQVHPFSQTEIVSTGYAGDHFSLEGALELFKQSKSPEDFEKKLNQEDNYVNNLDLNQDGEIDYIKVNDNMEGDVHAIALQVDVNEEESQDIAVIYIEKTGTENAILQIVGDEDVYGSEKIVEPYAVSGEFGGKGMANENLSTIRIAVNVWSWPSVRFVYQPNYRVYRSPYRWKHYPRWWKPWKPLSWDRHFSKRKVYHIHYRPTQTYRVIKAHTFYKPKRRSSVTVRTKTIETRTIVKSGPKGNKIVKSTTIKKQEKVKRKGRDAKVQSKSVNRKSKTVEKLRKGK